MYVFSLWFSFGFGAEVLVVILFDLFSTSVVQFLKSVYDQLIKKIDLN